MSNQENPALREVVQQGMELGLSKEALHCFVEGYTNALNQAPKLEMGEENGEMQNFFGKQAVENFLMEVSSPLEQSGTIFSSEAPVDANRNTNEGPDKQSKKPKNPWSKTTPSGYPRGPGSNAKKKAKEGEYYQMRIDRRLFGDPQRRLSDSSQKKK